VSAFADAGRSAWRTLRTRLGAVSPEQRAWLARKERDRRRGDHRAFVGPPELYDAVGRAQFELLRRLGLERGHHVLDVGCGSLRAGRFLIPWLEADHYCGLEPEAWLVAAGIEHELGREELEARRPLFDHGRDFAFGCFARSFDFVLAHSVFSHAPVAQIRRCLAEAVVVMRPEATLLASFVPGPRDYAGETWAHCAHYRPERLVELGAERGLDAELPDWAHPNGQRWLVLRRRPHPEGSS